MKYVGSKNRLSRYIVPIIQKCIDENNINTYVEPFVGGANIIDKIRCENKIASDINQYLIALFNSLKDNDIYIPERISREHYAEVKNDYQNKGSNFEDYYKGLIGFCGAFRGKFFDSCACYDYESEGRIRNNYKESLNNLLKQKDKLQDIAFLHCTYDKYKPEEYNNCIFYCDIPYKGTYGYNLDFDYEKFYNWCREISTNNFVFISEYEMPEDFHCIWQQEKKMCLQKESKRFTVVEKLFAYSKGKYAELYCSNMKGKH